MYIYEHSDWPHFKWDIKKLLPTLSLVRNMQGKIIGKMGVLGFELKKSADLDVLTLDVTKSSEIEGEILAPEQVKSSIARRLGIQILGSVKSDKKVDGAVDMTLDAVNNFDNELNKDRLFSWHKSLFPTGHSGMYEVIKGNWRDDSQGSMQVVSGPVGRENIHFQAPAASVIEKEMELFFEWLNKENDIDLVLKAGIAHLWFVTIHPFEDGNGRITRALTDMILARSDEQSQRFYSMSTQIMSERKEYYDILEKTQKGDLNITGWLEWFLNCLKNALDNSEIILKKVLVKHDFWIKYSAKIQNERQRKVLDMLLEGFEGKLTTSKWAKICKCSQDTALRDILDLVEKGILIKLPAGGRSTSYNLNID